MFLKYIIRLKGWDMANKFNSVIKRLDWKKIIGALLLITLLFSILYSIVKIVNAPHEGEGLDESVRVKVTIP